MIIHAGLIATRIRGAWRGVLIEGPSGCGKSELALQAMGAGFRLVADDRVQLWVSGGRLWGRAPETLAGLVEVRGVDVVRVAHVAMCEVALAVRHGEPERIPAPAAVDILGLRVPSLVLALGERSATAKLSHALHAFDGAANRRI